MSYPGHFFEGRFYPSAESVYSMAPANWVVIIIIIVIVTITCLLRITIIIIIIIIISYLNSYNGVQIIL